MRLHWRKIEMQQKEQLMWKKMKAQTKVETEFAVAYLQNIIAFCRVWIRRKR